MSGKSGGLDPLGSSAAFSEYGNKLSQERSTVSPTDAISLIPNTGSNAWKSSSQYPPNSLRHFGLASPIDPLPQWQSNFAQFNTSTQPELPPPAPTQSYSSNQYQYTNPILPRPYPQPSFSTNPSHHALPRIRTSPNPPPPQPTTNAFGETIYNSTPHAQAQSHSHHPNTHYGLLSPYFAQGQGGYAYPPPTPPQYQYQSYHHSMPYHQSTTTPTTSTHPSYLYTPSSSQHQHTGSYPSNGNTIQPSTFFSNSGSRGGGVDTIAGSLLGSPIKEQRWGEADGRRGSEVSDVGVKDEFRGKSETVDKEVMREVASGTESILAMGEDDPYRRDPPADTPNVRFTDEAEVKQTDVLKRFCTNCKDIRPPSWRKSVVKPGKILCNKCGIYERTHLRTRPISTIDGSMIRRPPKIILRTGDHPTATVKKDYGGRKVSGRSDERSRRVVDDDEEYDYQDGEGDEDYSPDESNYSSTMSQPTPLTTQSFPQHTTHTVISPLIQPLRRASIAISGTTHSQPFSPIQTPKLGRPPSSSSTLPIRQTRRRGDSSPYTYKGTGRVGGADLSIGGAGVGMSVGGLGSYAISNTGNTSGVGGLPGWTVNGGDYGSRKTRLPLPRNGDWQSDRSN